MSYEIVVNGELYHHGIKGQKWGIRRFQNKDGTRTAAGKKRVQIHEDYAKVRDGKSVKELSDSELRSRINRLQMENTYNKLNPTSVNSGKKFIKDSTHILKEYVAIVGITTASIAATKKIAKAIGTVAVAVKGKIDSITPVGG